MLPYRLYGLCTSRTLKSQGAESLADVYSLFPSQPYLYVYAGAEIANLPATRVDGIFLLSAQTILSCCSVVGGNQRLCQLEDVLLFMHDMTAFHPIQEYAINQLESLPGTPNSPAVCRLFNQLIEGLLFGA